MLAAPGLGFEKLEVRKHCRELMSVDFSLEHPERLPHSLSLWNGTIKPDTACKSVICDARRRHGDILERLQQRTVFLRVLKQSKQQNKLPAAQIC